MAAITPRGERRVESSSHHWGHLLSNPTLFILLECDCCGFSRKWAQPCQPKGAGCQEFPACSMAQPTPPAEVVYKSLDPLCFNRKKSVTIKIHLLCVHFMLMMHRTAELGRPRGPNYKHQCACVAAPAWHGLSVSACPIHRVGKLVPLLRPRVYWLEMEK